MHSKPFGSLIILAPSSCPPPFPPHSLPLPPSLHPSLTLPTPSATPPLNTPRRGAYATNSRVRNAACVCKDSLSRTRCFVCAVYAVFPPDTHGEVHIQYPPQSLTPTHSQVLRSHIRYTIYSILSTMYSEPNAIYYCICYILLYMLYTLYYANRQVLHSACVSKNSFIVCVHAVVPPDTHGEVRMQQGPKRRMRIQ